MNAPLADLDAIERRVLLERIAELESTVADWKARALESAPTVCVPPGLRAALGQLLADLQGRGDLGRATRLRIAEVRREMDMFAGASK